MKLKLLPTSARPQRLFLLTGGVQGFALSWGLAAVVWWVVDLKLSPLRLVLLGTALVVGIVLAEAPTGVVADLYSRKRSVVSAYVVMGAAMMLMPVSDLFGLMLLFQSMFAVGWTLQSGAATAWVTDELLAATGLPGDSGEPPEAVIPIVDRLILQHAMWRSLGGMVGIVVAAGIGAWSLRGAMVIMGALSVGFAGLLAATMPETGFRPAARPTGSPWRDAMATWRAGASVALGRRTLLGLVLCAGIAGFGGEAVERLDTLRLVQLGLPDFEGREAVLFFGVAWLVMAALAIPVMLWLRRRLAQPDTRRDAMLLMRLLLISGAGGIALAFSPWFAVAIAGWTIFDVAGDTTYPLAEAMINREAESETRATVISFMGQSQALGQVLGGLGLGAVAHFVSLPLALGLAGGLMAASAIPVAISRRAMRQSPSSP